MAAPRLQKHKTKSIISETLEAKKTLKNTNFENFKVSFQYLDTSQKFGSAFRDWQKVGLLSKMMEVLQGYCCRPLREQVDGDKFTIYNGFPPREKTRFEYPSMVPEDALWARIHITGSAIIAGHILQDTFYVVFLDKSHKFWLTKKVTNN